MPKHVNVVLTNPDETQGYLDPVVLIREGVIHMTFANSVEVTLPLRRLVSMTSVEVDEEQSGAA